MSRLMNVLIKHSAKERFWKKTLLGRFSDKVIKELCRKSTIESISAGSTLYSTNDPSTHMYVIGDGSVKLEIAVHRKNIHSKVIVKKGAGDIIGGEVVMSSSQSRKSTAVALEDCSLVSVSKEDLEKLLKDNERLQQIFSLMFVLSQQKLFKELYLSYFPHVHALFHISIMETDTILFEQGDPGDSLYILVKGSLQALITPDTDVDKEQKQVTADIKENNCVGEICLVIDSVRAATVKATSTSILIELRRAEFQNLLLSVPNLAVRVSTIARKNIAWNFRRYNIPFFAAMTSKHFSSLGKLCDLVEIPPGELIFDEGDVGDRFYMISNGVVGIYVDNKMKNSRRVTAEIGEKMSIVFDRPRRQTELPRRTSGTDSTLLGPPAEKERVNRTTDPELLTEIDRLGPGRYFGEIALVSEQNIRSATARSITRTVILSITKAKFDRFFSENPEPLSDFTIKLARYNVSLLQVLTHPIGLKFFLQHCESEYTVENVNFWREVYEYEKMFGNGKTAEEISAKGRHIITEYIRSDAKNQVNISGKCRTQTEMTENFRKDSFEVAKKQVFSLMESDSFKRFKSMPMFQEFLKATDAYEYI